MRPAQHFDALQVDQFEIAGGAASDIDAVEILADGRIDGGQRIGVTDAADERDAACGAADNGHDRDVGDHLADLVDAGDVQAFKLLRRKCRDGHRHALQVFRLAARGDGDLVKLDLGGLLRLGAKAAHDRAAA